MQRNPSPKQRKKNCCDQSCSCRNEGHPSEDADALCPCHNKDAMYRMLFEKSPEGVFILESQGPDAGKIVDVNVAAARMNGYSIDELKTMKIVDLDTPENVQKAPSRFRQIVDGEWISDQIMHRRKDGSLFPIEFKAGPLNINGKIYILAFVHDITKNKEAEKNALESKHFLRSILNSMADPVFVKDKKHRWIFLNDAFCAFMGHNRDEVLGKSDYDFFPKDQADVFWEKDELVFTSGKENINEEQFTDAKGVIHTIVTKKSIFTDPDGNKILVGIIRDITDQKTAEAKLQISETRFKTLYDKAADAIMLLAPEKGFIAGNAATIHLFECRNEQEFKTFTPDQLSPALQPDGRASSEKMKEMVQTALEKGTNFFEWKHKRMNGEEFFATVLLAKMELEGKVVLQATVRDITETKVAEESMRKLQNDQQVILDAVRAWIFYKDKDNRFLRVNKAFCDAMSMAREQLEGTSLFDLYPKEQAEQFWKDDKEVIASGKPKMGIVESMQSPEGLKWVQTDKIPYRNAEGTIIGVIGFSVDITSLHETRQKLEQEAENAKKFMEAVEASSIATVITTTEPGVLYANSAWEQLTGYSKEEAMNQNPRILQSGKTPRELYNRMWATILRGDEFATDEIINRRKNGSEYNAELHVFPIMENGKAKYFVGLQTDITLRKRADIAKSEFMSLASHQLRTPLTGIRWGLSLLSRREKLTLNQQALVNELQQQTSRMAESINVMLHLSRIEAGKMEVKNKPCALSSVINELCGEFHPLAEQKMQQCQFRLDDSITLTTDPALLKEILANLITNAIKYTPNNKTIELTTKVLGNEVHINVRDEGFGIPQDQQDKIFSKFFRATNVVDKIPDGTGLGLYLVYALTKLLGGRISFVSAENEGSTFSLTLPLTPPSNP